LLSPLLLSCSDVVSVAGHLDCTTDDGVELLQITGGVKMRDEGTNATRVSVSEFRNGVQETVADLGISIDRPSFDQWAGVVPPDEFGVTCNAPLNRVCYEFSAEGPDGLKVRDWLGEVSECDAAPDTSSSSSDGSGGGGGGDDEGGTLICNDGTTSSSCTACTSGCCSGHGGCG
jgi:hypothetical protein